MADAIVTRTHRVIAVAAGVVFGANMVVLGRLLGLLPAMVVAGLFVGGGTTLLLPALIHASETGTFPPTTGDSVLGTGLNPGALGFGLDLGGIGIGFAALFVEAALPSVGVGVGLLVVTYVLVDLAVPQ